MVHIYSVETHLKLLLARIWTENLKLQDSAEMLCNHGAIW